MVYDGAVKLVVGIFAVTLGLMFRVLFKLRLGVAVVYIALVNTLWADWMRAQPFWSMFVFIAILAVTALSWVFTLVRFVRDARA